MDDVDKVSCVLCLQCEETDITGALSTKDEVTAHQNCLLFSSGLFCRNSPQFDDLFGFSVEDVLNEVKRGSQLSCKKCKKKGATAGCEVKRCMKSYHYPCAVQDGANNVEDADQGKYGLYCFNHCQKTEQSNISVNGDPSSVTASLTSESTSEAGCSKKITNEHSRAARRLSMCRSDSSTCSSTKRSSFKRALNSINKKQGSAAKRRFRISDDSSTSDSSESQMGIEPLDTDFDGSELPRADCESPTGSTAGNEVGDGSVHGNDEDVTIIHSDAESESLLAPVSRSPSPTTPVASTLTAPTPSPCVVLLKMGVANAKRLDQGSSPVHGSAKPAAVPQQSSPGPPLSLARSTARTSSDREPGFHSSSFWKSCNAAGCTQALFTGFIDEMNTISRRIQSDVASQEDYDHALTVMTVSGKLTELVAKQQEELQRKLTELPKATAAMKKVVSALKTCIHQQMP